MRVTNTLFPTTLKSQLQKLQQRQVELETQSATGLSLQKSSDNPLAYSQVQLADSNQRELSSYLNSTSQATTLVTTNYNAMTNITTLLSRASELATKSTGYTDASGLNSIGVEMTSILDQLVTITNQQSDGNYVFGGTGNAAPITGTSGSYAYSSNAAYTANTTQVAISSSNVISTGLVAGQAGGFDGFLYQTTLSAGSGTLSAGLTTITGMSASDLGQVSVGQSISGTGIPAGTTVTAIDATTGTITLSQAATASGTMSDISSATDVLKTIQDLANQLNGTSPTSASATQLVQLNKGIDLNAQYVGKTAAQLSSLNLNKTTLTKISNSNASRISDLSAADLPTVLTDLQQTQTYYEAALQSGAKILTINLLDYIS